MQPKILLLSVLFFISFFSLAQNKHQDSGYIIYTLGKDTIEITHYHLTGDDFTATIVQRVNSSVKILLAGEYSIFTMPSKAGWTNHVQQGSQYMGY